MTGRSHFAAPLLLAVFVGLNLVQSAFTGFCPAEIILHQLGLGKDACGVQPEKRS